MVLQWLFPTVRMDLTTVIKGFEEVDERNGNFYIVTLFVLSMIVYFIFLSVLKFCFEDPKDIGIHFLNGGFVIFLILLSIVGEPLYRWMGQGRRRRDMQENSGWRTLEKSLQFLILFVFLEVCCT